MPSTKQTAADECVRAAVAAADRHRRRRAASARVWQIAPVVTGLALGVAAVGYWIGWPDAVPLALLAAACLAVVIQWILVRRDRAVSDAVAAAIDAEAGLRGELRSASWFAGRADVDDWAALHLDRAADRLQTLDWAQLYRPVRATRSRLATLAMATATLAIAIAIPDRVGAGRDLSALDSRRADRLAPSEMQALPPELLKQIEELLAAAEAGTLASRLNEGGSSAADMQELLERLRELRDPEALKELARAMDPDKTDMTAEALNALAERVKRAADMTASERAAREALEDLARNLNKAAEAEGLNERAEHAASSEAPENAGERTVAPGEQEMSQAVNEAQSAAGGAGVVMMSDQNAAGSASSPGFGLGGSGAMPTASEMAALDSALRHELVEASRDSGGANVEAEIRRKTEQGQASVAFTHSASGSSDVSRAATPPAVPEARRTDVQRYFIRKQ